MKKKMLTFYRTYLCLTILAAILTIGGVDNAFAQKQRYVFEVIAQNTVSKVTTTFQVYAENARDAKENVAANGWQILDVKQITFGSTEIIPVQLGSDSINYAVIDTPDSLLYDDGGATISATSKRTELPDDIIDIILRENNVESIYSNVYYIIPSSGNITAGGSQDMLAQIPGLNLDLERLEHKITVYFDLGQLTPIISESDRQIIENLNNSLEYYIIGHTDNTKVIANDRYKDNYDISFKRAEAVRNILEQSGVNAENISTVGLGALYPAVENLPGGTPANRRAEIYEYK